MLGDEQGDRCEEKGCCVTHRKEVTECFENAGERMLSYDLRDAPLSDNRNCFCKTFTNFDFLTSNFPQEKVRITQCSLHVSNGDKPGRLKRHIQDSI